MIRFLFVLPRVLNWYSVLTIRIKLFLIGPPDLPKGSYEIGRVCRLSTYPTVPPSDTFTQGRPFGFS